MKFSVQFLLTDCVCVCVSVFHRNPQCASESEKHCICGLSGVDKVWSSRPGLEEGIL